MRIVVESMDVRAEIDPAELLRSGKNVFSFSGLKLEFDDVDAFHVDSDRGSLFLVIDSELGFANFTYSGYEIKAYLAGGVGIIDMRPYRLYIQGLPSHGDSGEVKTITLGLSGRNMVRVEIDEFRVRRIETAGYVDIMALSGRDRFELYYGDVVLTVEKKRHEAI